MKRVGTLLLAAAVGGMLVAGCDIPTAPPIVEQRWALLAAETTLGVDDLDLGGEPQQFDLGEQDEVDELVKRIQAGSATATISNDFPVGVSGTFTLGDTTRTIAVEPGATTEVTISYTREELRELLSGPVTYSWTGSVTDAGEHRFDASMRITIRVRIDITLRTEPEE